MILPAMALVPFSRTRYLPTSERATVNVGRLKKARASVFGMAVMTNGKCRSRNFQFLIARSSWHIRRSEVPCHAPHHCPGIARHKVNVRHPGRLSPKARLERKDGLFPLRIEKVLNEKKRLEPPMR